MQIVIDIPKEQYIATKVMVESHNVGSSNDRAIANGTPLPEHHGRLIDASTIEEPKYNKYDPFDNFNAFRLAIGSAPTIIPATKEKSCENCRYCVGYKHAKESIFCSRCIQYSEYGSKQTATKEGE